MSYLVKCDCCGGMRPKQEMIETDDGTLCPNCTVQCDNCGETFHTDTEMFEVSSDGVEMLVCWDCYMNNEWDDEEEE